MTPSRLRLCILALAAFAHPSLGNARPDDPTSGKFLIFPGQTPGATIAQPSPLAAREGEWNIPGRHFRPNGGWWTLICGADCVLASRRLQIRAGTHWQHEEHGIRSQILSWLPQTATPNPVDIDGQTVLHFKPVVKTPSMKFKPGPVPTWRSTAVSDAASENARNKLRRAAIRTPGGHTAILRPRAAAVHTGRKHPSQIDESAPHALRPASVSIELSFLGQRQVLGQVHGEYDLDALPTLSATDYMVWSGDLDGDGKLDILLRYDLNQWDVALYLSSFASPGEIVGEAGRFRFAPFSEPGY